MSTPPQITAFLVDLEAMSPPSDTNWLLIGDFNLTSSPADKNNANFDQRLAARFNTAIDSLALIELPLLGRLYTWPNKRATPTLARLDHAFIDGGFNQLFLNSCLSSTSDLVPLILTAPTSIPKSFLFRFENAWLKHPTFLPSILPV
jgi:endonuclease/exonuclease/phosphatase family metal-dependent hydrolase